MNENIIYALNEAADYLESINEAAYASNKAKVEKAKIALKAGSEEFIRFKYGNMSEAEAKNYYKKLKVEISGLLKDIEQIPNDTTGEALIEALKDTFHPYMLCVHGLYALAGGIGMLASSSGAAAFIGGAAMGGGISVAVFAIGLMISYVFLKDGGDSISRSKVKAKLSRFEDAVDNIARKYNIEVVQKKVKLEN